jgi:hypothetical protein
LREAVVSDFDAALERLIVDPAFKAALAGDPALALSGYRLSEDEAELLRSQITSDTGGNRAVEERVNKAGVVGLLSELSGLGSGFGPAGGHPTGGSNTASGIGGGAGGYTGSGIGGSGDGGGIAGAIGHHIGSLGPGDGSSAEHDYAAGSGTGYATPRGGEVPGTGGQVAPYGTEGVYRVPGVGEQVAPYGGGSGFAPGDHVPANYHPHVDADGDGKWDSYVAVQHSDGGVDIYEDRNHDGIVDFDGHDRNADGVIDSADYDENFDGVAETHMTDLNGDGWMDTRTVDPHRT